MIHLLLGLLTTSVVSVFCVVGFVCFLIVGARHFNLESIPDSQWKSYNH